METTFWEKRPLYFVQREKHRVLHSFDGSHINVMVKLDVTRSN